MYFVYSTHDKGTSVGLFAYTSILPTGPTTYQKEYFKLKMVSLLSNVQASSLEHNSDSNTCAAPCQGGDISRARREHYIKIGNTASKLLK